VTPRHFIAALAVLALTVVPVPAAAQPPPGAPDITVDPAAITSVQRVDEQVTHQLTIGNAGDAALDWRVYEDSGAARRLPIRPATPVRTVPAPNPGGSATLETYPGHRGRPGWTVQPASPPPPAGALAIGHSQAPTITAGSSIACARSRGVNTTAAGYLRHFTLDDFGITGELDVTSVSFGVESLGGASQLTVNLYTMVDPGGLLVYENLALIGSATANAGKQTMTIVEVPVTGTAPAGSTLVVEVAAPDTSRGGFFIGANPGGQTAGSYLRAAACGIPQPASTSALGAPGMQILLSVTGVTDLPDCDVPTGWVDLAPHSGTVAPGGGQPAAVTFDSTGRAVGDELHAELCLLSNDPDQALAVVPLNLRVERIPDIEVTPDALTATQRAGTVPAQTLTIGNTGDGPLDWRIDEAEAAGCEVVADVPWLDVSPATGTTGPGQASDVTAAFEVTGLATGEHRAALCVRSNDPATPTVVVPVTLTVTVTCDVTITGRHAGPLTVTGGTTCLAPGARIEGEVNVFDGAGLAANSAVVQGPLATFGATTVEMAGGQVIGPISVRGTLHRASLTDLQVVGSVLVVNNQPDEGPAVVAGNWIVGSLFCTGNQPPPVHHGVPNTVVGGLKLDQCAPL
jgi:BACON domain-containing protein